MGNRVVLWKSASVPDMASAPSAEIFRPAPGQPNSANVWAPELHRLDDKWYVYFTAGSGPDETQRLWVLECTGADPQTGTWVQKGRIFSTDADFWAIDGTVLEYNGSRYLIWSGRPDATKQDQWLFIARMENPWTLQGPSAVLSKPELSWERNGGPVNEAPQVLKNSAGRVFITYSASGCWTDDYALGLLTLKPGGNPMMPTDWEKSQTPVFTKNPAGGAFGPGHNAFFASPDGKEDWIIYHANNNSNEGCGERRNVRIQPFVWSAAGVPQLGSPVRTGDAQNRPSGE
jgi:GH43 family beta-xylosidase